MLFDLEKMVQLEGSMYQYCYHKNISPIKTSIKFLYLKKPFNETNQKKQK